MSIRSEEDSSPFRGKLQSSSRRTPFFSEQKFGALQSIFHSTAVKFPIHCSGVRILLKCIPNSFSEGMTVWFGKDWSFPGKGLEFCSERIEVPFEKDWNLFRREFLLCSRETGLYAYLFFGFSLYEVSPFSSFPRWKG